MVVVMVVVVVLKTYRSRGRIVSMVLGTLCAGVVPGRQCGAAMSPCINVLAWDECNSAQRQLIAVVAGVFVVSGVDVSVF